MAEAEFEVTDELVDALDEVIRSVVSLYQPIFDITGGPKPVEEYPVVAYEALARGPKGSRSSFRTSCSAPLAPRDAWPSSTGSAVWRRFRARWTRA